VGSSGVQYVAEKKAPEAKSETLLSLFSGVLDQFFADFFLHKTLPLSFYYSWKMKNSFF
jgi:hypothetical protein